MRLGAALLAAATLAGCGGSGASGGASNEATTATTSTPGFHLSSPAFAAGGRIPAAYTCNGAGAAIPLHWSGVPTGTRELVLVMRDPDAPGGTFIHWTLAGINPTTTGLPTTGVLVAGRNSARTTGYTPPCPPAGGRPHHYVLTLTALATRSGLRPGWSPNQLHGRTLGTAVLTGTYSR